MMLAYSNSPGMVGEGNYPFRQGATSRCSACFSQQFPGGARYLAVLQKKKLRPRKGTGQRQVPRGASRARPPSPTSGEHIPASLSSPGLGLRGWTRPRGDRPPNPRTLGRAWGSSAQTAEAPRGSQERRKRSGLSL